MISYFYYKLCWILFSILFLKILIKYWIIILLNFLFFLFKYFLFKDDLNYKIQNIEELIISKYYILDRKFKKKFLLKKKTKNILKNYLKIIYKEKSIIFSIIKYEFIKE
jgi:hypothetical protein